VAHPPECAPGRRSARLKDVKDAEPIYRLISTILDPTQAPAKELAALYHERWEIGVDELKTPELVKQGSRAQSRRRSRSSLLPAPGARKRKALHEANLREILRERVVSSRNRINLRGVRRKMSDYNPRPRKRRRIRRVDVSERIRIIKRTVIGVRAVSHGGNLAPQDPRLILAP
jgi:hypothetical protein